MTLPLGYADFSTRGIQNLSSWAARLGHLRLWGTFFLSRLWALADMVSGVGVGGNRTWMLQDFYLPGVGCQLNFCK